MEGITQPSTQPELASAEADGPSAQLLSGTKRTVSEAAGSPTDQAEDAAPPSPKRRKGSDASKHTESRGSPSPGEQNAAGGAPLKAHGGWNQGVSGGLRTSFGSSSKAKRPTRRSAQPAAESTDVSSLVMPSGNANAPKPSQKDEWQSVFTRWCVRLMALNKGHDGLKDAALLGEAWRFWLKTQTPFSRAQQSAAVRAGKEASLDNDKVQDMFTEAATADTAQPWNGSPAAETSQADSPLSEGQIRDSAQSQSSASSRPQSRAGQEANGWALPPPLPLSEFEAKQKDQNAWEEKFLDWCKLLVRLNDGDIKAETPKERNRVAETYSRWIGGIDKLSKAKAATARRAAVHYAQENGPQLAALFAAEVQATGPVPLPDGDSAPSPTTAAPAGLDDDNATNDAPDGPVAVGGLDAESYRETYFPGTGDASPFCHACATRGHNASACPHLACRFCHHHDDHDHDHDECPADHRSFACPSRLRCAKCKQLGHVRRNCAEKLALPPGEVECAFCGVVGEHVDGECHEVWRSFLLTEENGAVRKVRALPVYCYTCGREGHYGPECGLNPQRTKVGPWETWCRANCERYVDKEATEVAVVYQGQGQDSAGGVAPERPHLGKSIVPRRHIFFEESDDDEDWFVPPEAQSDRWRPPAGVNISFSFSSQIGAGGGSRGGRRPSRQDNNHGNGNGNGAFGYAQQPPLPPGPPPPLPPPPQQQRYHQENGRNGGRRGRGRGGARY